MADQRYSRVWGSATVGIDAVSVCIETYLANGLPKHTVVGLPRGAVRESLDRIWAAMRSAGYSVPRGILTVNLAPADVAKEGTAYDLPVAIGIIAADRQEILPDSLDEWMILGELTLNGGVRAVRGVLSSALRARRDGLRRMIVPVQNAGEAASVDGLEVYGVSTLAQTFDVLNGGGTPFNAENGRAAELVSVDHLDMADVMGQSSAKRAMTIAAAGGHNLLLTGPPGCGKTMLARRFPGILPLLSDEESLETTAIHSLRGGARQTSGRTGLLRTRPFRAPHHSITRAGMTGGGTPT
ncbi:MAG: ATP-binding protein, partial [Rhodothermales bacterium]|nr:ATP-binding protein [Rhodothermales bacterium]